MISSLLIYRLKFGRPKRGIVPLRAVCHAGWQRLCAARETDMTFGFAGHRRPMPKIISGKGNKKLDEISEQVRYMSKYGIETFDDLYADRDRLQGEMNKLIAYRTKLQNKIRRASPAEKETLREEKSKVTEQITALRKQLKLNKGIEERSIKIQEKTDLLYANEYRAKEAEQNRKSQRKERDAR